MTTVSPVTGLGAITPSSGDSKTNSLGKGLQSHENGTNFKSRKPRRRQRQTDNDILESLKNSGAKNDIFYLLRILAPTTFTKHARARAHQQITEVVLSVQAHGENYEVFDASSMILGKNELCIAPLELVIIDRGRTDGITPDHGDAALPTCYDAISFAQKLARYGVAGYFEDYNVLCASGNSSYIHRISWEANGAVPTYTPFAKIHPVLQPIIIVPQLFPNSPPVHIHLAHPSNPHRLSFVQEHMKSIKPLPHLTVITWLWSQSIEVSQLSLSGCALLSIQHMQALHDPPKPIKEPVPSKSMDSADGPATYKGFWQRFTSSGGAVEYAYTPPVMVPGGRRSDVDVHITSLLYNTFRVLSKDSKSKASVVFSVREGLTIPRTSPLAPVSVSPKLNSPKNAPKKSMIFPPAVNQSISSNGESQPYFWQYQAFVVQDPFVPLQNVTNTIDKDACKTLTTAATSAALGMKRGEPLFTILGQEFIKKLKDTYLIGAPQLQTPFRTPGFFTPTKTFPDILAHRSRIVQQVQDVVQRKYGRGYTVECFGSTRYGVDSASSDLDLVIIDYERIDGFAPSVNIKELPEIYDIQSLAQCLRYGKFIVQQKIPKASVPIVKFKDSRTGICCDVNVNDQLGVFNTQLISRYCELSPVLRPLLKAIKLWAKPLGLNNPSARGAASSFSSYALTLMTIAFLQTRGLLPNLQGALEKISPSSTLNGYVEGTFWLRSKSNIRQRCDRRFNRLEGWVVPADTKDAYGEGDVGRALYEWFKFFGHEHKYAENLLSVQHGGLVRRVGASISDSPSRRSEYRKRKKARLAEQKNRSVNDEVNGAALDEQSPNGEKDTTKTFIKSVQDIQDGVATLGVGDSTIRAPSQLETPVNSTSTEDTEDADLVDSAEDVQNRTRADDSDKVEADEEAVQDAALEYDFNDIDLPAGKQPDMWTQQKLVVSDPFIPSKNCAGAINKITIERFIQECRRAAVLMELGCSFADLVGFTSKESGLQRTSRSKQGRPQTGGSRESANHTRTQSPLRKAIGRPRSAKT